MKIVNTSGRTLAIPTPIETTILERGDDFAVTEVELVQLKRNSMIRNWLHRGMLTVQGGEAAPAPAQDDKRPEPALPEGVEGKGVEIVAHDGGWYSVYVNGMPVTDKKVRKGHADEIAAEYA